MNSFRIEGDNNFFMLTIDKVLGFPNYTSHWGGYDTKSTMEVFSHGFNVLSKLYVSTGELFEFYMRLSNANELITGDLTLNTQEDNLKLNLKYDTNGHVVVSGIFSGNPEFGNCLQFEFYSDQSYINKTLSQLKGIVEKYGDMNGKKI